MSAEETDLRATLENAFDHAETGGPTENAPEPVRAAPEKTEAGATPIPTEDRGDGRRVDGKFARSKPAAAPADGGAADGGAAAGDQAAQAVKPEGEPQRDPFAKAPQSWKPGAREAWGQLPADVRAEVHRREREAAQVMQETAQARQVNEYVAHLHQQFAPALQAEGVDVLTASANLMNLASRLRFGTPVEKAQLAATIVRNYGVDVNALADALDRLPAGQIHQMHGQQPQHQQQM
ncbi:MAG: hypothetical protein LUQ37_06075, partial [Methanoregulaceae archaeon]|nr:hypothetical protein [Methanoregulaceae archaeon]